MFNRNSQAGRVTLDYVMVQPIHTILKNKVHRFTETNLKLITKTT